MSRLMKLKVSEYKKYEKKKLDLNLAFILFIFIIILDLSIIYCVFYIVIMNSSAEKKSNIWSRC